MRSSQQCSITLWHEPAIATKAKATNTGCANESEVTREGLRALFACDQAHEQWLRTEVAASYDELNAEPSNALTPTQVRLRVAQRHLARGRVGKT